MAQNNLDLIPVVIDISSATTTVLAPGTMGWKIFGQRLRLTITGSNVVTLASGANTLEKFTTTSAGLQLVYDYDNRPWYTTNPGEDFNVITSTGNPVSGVFEYILQS